MFLEFFWTDKIFSRISLVSAVEGFYQASFSYYAVLSETPRSKIYELNN